jgi:hypothetical protein
VKRWGVLVAVGVVAVLVVVGLFAVGEPPPRVDDRIAGTDCHATSWVVLAAQAVPSAAFVPCLGDPPEDWVVVDQQVESGRATMVLATTGVDGVSAEVVLEAACEVDGAAEPVDPDPDDPVSVTDAAVVEDGSTVRTTGWAPFDGGCLTVEVETAARVDLGRVLDELDASLEVAPRPAVAREVEEATDGRLTLDPPR